MKILILADEESKSLWDFYEPGKLEGIDLIISCGDLNAHYLSFLATMCHAPVLYVHGNHDQRYLNTPPGGCICIDDSIYCFRGLKIMGLGGCMRYKPGPFMYSEKEMAKRFSHLRRKMFFNGSPDILVGHAPAYQINDLEDLPHRGFKTFVTMMDKYEPRYFLHGHVHANYGQKFKRETQYNKTTIINGFEKYILEIDDASLPEDHSRKAKVDHSGNGYFIYKHVEKNKGQQNPFLG